jgi:uncharacterized protein YnzC (UPF0291/DUF896 family)
MTESELLQKINAGWSEDEWSRYHTLTRKRRSKPLTAQEREELLQWTKKREVAHAERIDYLVQLARLRHISLEETMEQLDIRTPGYV